MNHSYEKHDSLTSKQLRLESRQKIQNSFVRLRNHVASAMSAFIETLRSDFIIFSGEKSLHIDLGRRKSLIVRAVSRMLSE